MMVRSGINRAFLGMAYISLAVSCGKKDDETTTATIPATVTLSGTMKLGVTSLNGKALSLAAANAPVAGDNVFCVTFGETPVAGKGSVASDGKFSLSMPGGASLGCFLNSSLGATKATFIFPSTSSVGTSGSTSMALGANIEFGDITVGADGKIAVSAAAIEKTSATAVLGSAKSSGINLDDLHNKLYKLSCVTSGDATIDAACKKDMEGSGSTPYVYWRVVKGTEGGKAVTGLGAWESKDIFTACGSIDGTNAEKAAITGVTFTQFDSAASYTAASACVLSYGETVRSKDSIQGYYMLSEAVADGAGGYSVRAESPYKISSTCTTYHYTSIIMTGTTDTMYGAFVSEERAGPGCTDAEKSQAGEYSAKFTMKFTKI